MTRKAWGKTDRERGGAHPLAHHCMDVAAVFARMTELPTIRNRLNVAADAPLTDSARQRLAALVFLHDIGKLHPGFQAKGWPSKLWNRSLREHLKEGWAFLTLALKWPEHPFHETMREIMQWGTAVAPLIAATIVHHGRPVEPPSAPLLRDWPSLPHYDWQVEARAMDEVLHRWFAGAFESGGASLSGRPQFHHAVAGLVALADWIGSDTRFFRFAEPLDRNYNSTAHSAAAQALAAIGLDPGTLTTHPVPDFARLHESH